MVRAGVLRLVLRDGEALADSLTSLMFGDPPWFRTLRTARRAERARMGSGWTGRHGWPF